MEPNNKLALVVAYYLSRFGKDALNKLGYKTYRSAFQKIGLALGMNPNTVKNMRDEFDPITQNDRVGWYQRPPRPSRRRVIETFQEMSEINLSLIVKDILLEGGATGNNEHTDLILKVLDTTETESGIDGVNDTTLRAVTGQNAEEYFVKYYAQTRFPVKGDVEDVRLSSVGYDFQIVDSLDCLFGIEVKGLAGQAGGITFTDNEWSTAKRMKEKYYLCVVSELETSPHIRFYNNPALSLKPSLYLYPIVRVSWNVSHEQLIRF